MAYCAAGALVALPERSWRTPRPGRAVLAGFGLFLAVNPAVVVVLGVVGVAFIPGRRMVTHPALVAFLGLCLADWVLVEDMGIFGGLGTDPNSMIPMALLAAGGYLAVTVSPPPCPLRENRKPTGRTPADQGRAGVTGCGRPRCGSRPRRRAPRP